MRFTAFIALLIPAAASLGAQQSPQTGPVIASAGGAFAVEGPEFVTPTGHTFRPLYMVSQSGGRDKVNDSFDTAARFFNMHARAGIPLERIQVAIVVRGPASVDLLNDAEYRKRFGVANPNAKTLEELMKAGAKVIFCGQTAAARGVTKEMLMPGVQVALSAMTALVTLQDQGYRLIPF